MGYAALIASLAPASTRHLVTSKRGTACVCVCVDVCLLQNVIQAVNSVTTAFNRGVIGCALFGSDSSAALVC